MWAGADNKHLAVLAKKDGKLFEVHARRGGDVRQIRTVDAPDPKYGTMVK